MARFARVILTAWLPRRRVNRDKEILTKQKKEVMQCIVHLHHLFDNLISGKDVLFGCRFVEQLIEVAVADDILNVLYVSLIKG